MISLHRIALLLVLLVAAWLRFGVLGGTELSGAFQSDDRAYLTYAINVDRFGVYSRTFADGNVPPPPDTVRPPAFPAMASLLVDWQDPWPGVRSVLFVQALLSVLTVFLTYALAREFVGPWWSVMAAALVATNPHLINLNVYFLTGTLFAFLLMMSLLALAANRDGPRDPTIQRWLPWLLGGTMLGMCALTRWSALALPLVVVLVIMARERPNWRIAASTFLGGFLLMVGSWSIQSETSPDAPEQAPTLLRTIHHGMYPDYRFEGRDDTFGYPYLFNPRRDEIESSYGALADELTRRFREEPGRHLSWYLMGKPIGFWSWNIVNGVGDIFVYRATESPYYERREFTLTWWSWRQVHGVIVVLALVAGLSILLWPTLRTEASPLLLVVAAIPFYMTVLHMVTASFPRYAIPMMPIICVLFVWGVAQVAGWGWRKIRS